MNIIFKNLLCCINTGKIFIISVQNAFAILDSLVANFQSYTVLQLAS